MPSHTNQKFPRYCMGQEIQKEVKLTVVYVNQEIFTHDLCFGSYGRVFLIACFLTTITARHWLAVSPACQIVGFIWHHTPYLVLYTCTPAGFGQSTQQKVDNSTTTAFMLELVEALGLGPAPVIISPSMSGRFSIPFLTLYPEKFRGYVPVAPVYTDRFSDKFRLIKVRIIWSFLPSLNKFSPSFP